MVHRLMVGGLDTLCFAEDIKLALIGTLAESLNERYRKAIRQVRFPFEVERCGTPMTAKHYFNDTLDKWCAVSTRSCWRILTLHSR